jgi:two-component system response regulator RpaA
MSHPKEERKKWKQDLTTGQVAKICSVAPRTVSQWFDSGMLSGYRIPGGKDRRIPVDHMRKFMVDNDIPTDRLDYHYTFNVLFVTPSESAAQSLRAPLAGDSEMEALHAHNVFSAGQMVQRTSPRVIVIDMALGEYESSLIASARPEGRTFIALANEDDSDPERWTSTFHVVLRKPVDPESLAALIRRFKSHV